MQLDDLKSQNRNLQTTILEAVAKFEADTGVTVSRCHYIQEHVAVDLDLSIDPANDDWITPDVQAKLPDDIQAICKLLAIDPRQWRRWRRDGIPAKNRDRFCEVFGLHRSQVRVGGMGD